MEAALRLRPDGLVSAATRGGLVRLDRIHANIETQPRGTGIEVECDYRSPCLDEPVFHMREWYVTAPARSGHPAYSQGQSPAETEMLEGAGSLRRIPEGVWYFARTPSSTDPSTANSS